MTTSIEQLIGRSDDRLHSLLRHHGVRDGVYRRLLHMMASAAELARLPPDEKRAWNDGAQDRVDTAMREMIATAKARQPDPHAGEYLAWRTMGLVCILVVKHRDLNASLEISRDGGAAPRVYLPKSKIVSLIESTDDFLVALLPRSFVKWIGIKDPIGGVRMRELFGVTLPLAVDRGWTEAQCEAWARLDLRRMSINSRIQTAKSRTKYSTLSRSQVA